MKCIKVKAVPGGIQFMYGEGPRDAVTYIR